MYKYLSCRTIGGDVKAGSLGLPTKIKDSNGVEVKVGDVVLYSDSYLRPIPIIGIGVVTTDYWKFRESNFLIGGDIGLRHYSPVFRMEVIQVSESMLRDFYEKEHLTINEIDFSKEFPNKKGESI